MAALSPDVDIALAPERCHDWADAALHAQQKDGCWAAPMETAIVAVAAAQHSLGSRTMADAAYDQLLAWLEGNMPGDDLAWPERTGPRALGDDPAAAALALMLVRNVNFSLDNHVAQVARSSSVKKHRKHPAKHKPKARKHRARKHHTTRHRKARIRR